MGFITQNLTCFQTISNSLPQQGAFALYHEDDLLTDISVIDTFATLLDPHNLFEQ